jgi:GxxExxY protein
VSLREVIFTLSRKVAKNTMTENELSKIIVDCCFKIHTTLGPGLLESVYEETLTYELIRKGLFIKRQQGIAVIYEKVKMDLGFRADLIVEDKVLIEIKSVENIVPVHQKQVLTYLKLTGLKLGLLINFNEALIKNGIQRIVNGL